MILRRPLLNATSAVSASKVCVRNLQHSIPIRPVPKPIPFIPDHTAFLTAIGRGLSEHAPKIPSWDALFTLSSHQLKELGIEKARARKYILHWREKFRNGEYGIGGDCQHVTDGVAELKLVEAPVGNHPIPGMAPRSTMAAKRVQGVVVKGANTIKGGYVEPVKGSGGLKARIRLQEGIWEERQGHKVDGGERRRAEVRAKARAKANKEKNS
jgi:hypothetical protein